MESNNVEVQIVLRNGSWHNLEFYVYFVISKTQIFKAEEGLLRNIH